MQSHTNLQVADNPIGWALGHDEPRWVGARILTFLTTCVDAYTASIVHQELSRLSEAELERRGIPRGDLHRHTFLGPYPGGEPTGQRGWLTPRRDHLVWSRFGTKEIDDAPT